MRQSIARRRGDLQQQVPGQNAAIPPRRARPHPALLGMELLVLLTGCAAVGPDYAPPEPKTPAGWHGAADQGGITVAPTSAAELARWWTVFNDSAQSRLVEQAAAGNTDIREARARRGISRAARFPTVAANGSATSSHSSEETGSGSSRELYSASFDAKWELDLFGAKRRAEEAAQADLEASGEDLNDVLVSLLAEVARNYVEARSYQARLAVAREESAALTRQRVATGLTAQLELEQAVTQPRTGPGAAPALASGLNQAENRLAVLLSKPPGALAEAFTAPQPVPAAPERIVVGVPAEMLRHRPDVRRAERELAAQTARIGEATAALYPDFSLSGSIGLDALTPGRLFNRTARSSSAGAGLAWSIFDFGAIRQNIEIQNARQEQALGKYQGAVLTALAEVENALIAYVNGQQRQAALARATTAADCRQAGHRPDPGLGG